MAWSWHFTPTRIYTDKRFLRLSKTDELAAGFLLRLYHACDRHGRGPADDLALGVQTGLVAADDLLERLERLYATGMVLRSPDGSSWELERYDDDAPRDVKRDRPASEHAQGQQNGSREKSGEHPGSIRGEPRTVPDGNRDGTGSEPEDSRVAPAHARAHAPPRALPPGREEGRKEERQGKAESAALRPPLSEPSPPGSTDARAIESPSSPAPLPALEAREAPEGDPGGNGQSPPKRPKVERGSMLTPKERAEREELLRASDLVAEAKRRNDAVLGEGNDTLPDAQPPPEIAEDEEPDWDALAPMLAARSAPPGAQA